MKFVKTFPVYPNKWRFYMAPLLDGNDNKDEILEFNWFTCSCPRVDDKDNNIVIVSKYNTFYDTNSGKSFYVKYDLGEDVKLLVVNSIENISTDALQKSIKDGYHGIVHDKSSTNEKYKRDLLYENTIFYFNSEILIESSVCPYLCYVLMHKTQLIKNGVLTKTQIDELKDAKPGKISKLIRNILIHYW